MAETWWVYFLECRGGSLYIGIARDAQKRYAQHVRGKGAKYTRMNPPVRLLGAKHYPNHAEAARAEVDFKRLPTHEKWRWVAGLFRIID